METNKKTPNLGKSLRTENGNYFICKEGFFFYMTPTGIHLDGYEKEKGIFHSSKKWGDMKAAIGEPEPLTEDLAKKAAFVIKTKLRPMQIKIEKRKMQDAKAIERNSNIKETYQKPFGSLKTILRKAS